MTGNTLVLLPRNEANLDQLWELDGVRLCSVNTGFVFQIEKNWFSSDYSVILKPKKLTSAGIALSSQKWKFDPKPAINSVQNLVESVYSQAPFATKPAEQNKFPHWIIHYPSKSYPDKIFAYYGICSAECPNMYLTVNEQKEGADILLKEFDNSINLVWNLNDNFIQCAKSNLVIQLQRKFHKKKNKLNCNKIAKNEQEVFLQMKQFNVKLQQFCYDGSCIIDMKNNKVLTAQKNSVTMEERYNQVLRKNIPLIKQQWILVPCTLPKNHLHPNFMQNDEVKKLSLPQWGGSNITSEMDKY